MERVGVFFGGGGGVERGEKGGRAILANSNISVTVAINI